jgi:hypothetical protein
LAKTTSNTDASPKKTQPSTPKSTDPKTAMAILSNLNPNTKTKIFDELAMLLDGVPTISSRNLAAIRCLIISVFMLTNAVTRLLPPTSLLVMSHRLLSK